jgi:predicted enzyme related to lactoylglutathione lyase
MGQPVVHFEVMGKDGAKLRSFYSDLFSWDIDADNPMGYGMVAASESSAGDSVGGGIGEMPDGHPGYATFYVEVPSVEAALVQAAQLGGSRLMGPETPMEGLTIGMFADPEGHPVGLVEPRPA